MIKNIIWHGSAHVADGEREITGKVSARGSAAWEALQPILQKRGMFAQLEIHHGGHISTDFKINLQQSFTGAPL